MIANDKTINKNQKSCISEPIAVYFSLKRLFSLKWVSLNIKTSSNAKKFIFF